MSLSTTVSSSPLLVAASLGPFRERALSFCWTTARETGAEACSRLEALGGADDCSFRSICGSRTYASITKPGSWESRRESRFQRVSEGRRSQDRVCYEETVDVGSKVVGAIESRDDSPHTAADSAISSHPTSCNCNIWAKTWNTAVCFPLPRPAWCSLASSLFFLIQLVYPARAECRRHLRALDVPRSHVGFVAPCSSLATPLSASLCLHLHSRFTYPEDAT